MRMALPPRPPQPWLHTRPNRTHMFPSFDSIVTSSYDATITETDSYNGQQPMDVLLIEV